MDPLIEQRERMIREQLVARGIRSPRVLAAMRAIPRERFVPPERVALAYADGPLDIGEGQTISQPYVVALMAEALDLEGHERALEVGTGSGYGAAVLGALAADVVSVERFPALAAAATERLADLGLDNVQVVVGDGTLGVPERAPFDAIVVTAGAPAVPPALLAQLSVGGRLVIPVGPDRTAQILVRVRRDEEGAWSRDFLGPVHFVPLVGAQGWRPSTPVPESPGPRHRRGH